MDIREFHWLMNIVQNLDVGLVVLDREYRIQVWNGFMESHSGRLAGEVRDQGLFSLFPDVDKAWLEHKANMVFKLNNRAFSTWEQRPYLLRFSNYRPITGSAPYMYQNLTLVPLADFAGEVTHLAIIIYDATDEAMLITGQRQG
ncbi:PAS domain-containing protein [Aeromonas caviae]